ncbi:NADP-dependent oxidoreductase [Cryobacterium sp. CG_9.6]|uniref:NADP-dependent oxidoreductase n=1 Tax=Cryobacterium sp. CG_9.6 TaxID=2760710 RepID=UPI0024747A4C|nr:NADP-dependent oxidoreductase [Cryobacterium sp. CG_9.6]MDH6235487.1 NADPH:quinone reductase-like Zn-dependent oxidoreductase [Cryobacterium sp. CG_9.6]
MAQRWIATDFGGLDVFEQVETDVPTPGPGEVTIEVQAAGMNPADFKHVAGGQDRNALPVAVGYEVSGVISALGSDTQIASGGGAIGDSVIAFRVAGGYASAITVPATDVFAKPAILSFPEAANLLLAGTTAAEMLHVTGVTRGETILVHGASGAVGVSVLQQAKIMGVHVIGTSSEANFHVVAKFGGQPVLYGEDLRARVQRAAPDGVVAALDCVGTDEAIDVSLALVSDRARIVSIAAFGRAERDGFRIIAGAIPASTAFRNEARARILELADAGDLVVPMARTFPLSAARDALEFLSSQHPGGKLALIPER